jgi:IstB-like ATP binding protein
MRLPWGGRVQESREQDGHLGVERREGAVTACKDLGLTCLAPMLPTLLDTAREQQLPHELFLLQALEAGHSVVFSTLSQLANGLESGAQFQSWRGRLRRYVQPHVLVIDEIGYTRLTPAQAHALFELVNARYEKALYGIATRKADLLSGELYHRAQLALDWCGILTCPMEVMNLGVIQLRIR